MTKRAKNLIEQTYGTNKQPAIFALVEFAAQNPGADPRNYYDPYDRKIGRIQVYNDGVLSYRREMRSINQDWQRFKNALAVAAVEQVTDADVIAEATGRLTWISKDFLREKHGMNTDYTPRWDYCTGQYFPTEYRKAAASLLECAIRRVRQARPKTKVEIGIATIGQLKALNEKNGGCWFGPGEMQFFGTKIETGILRGHYFVTSEQPPHGPRKYSVRSFDEEGSVDTVGEFCAYGSREEALAAIPPLP